MADPVFEYDEDAIDEREAERELLEIQRQVRIEARRADLNPTTTAPVPSIQQEQGSVASSTRTASDVEVLWAQRHSAVRMRELAVTAREIAVNARERALQPAELQSFAQVSGELSGSVLTTNSADAATSSALPAAGPSDDPAPTPAVKTGRKPTKTRPAKTVNDPANANVTLTTRNASSSRTIVTSRDGPLRAPGSACSDPACKCAHTPWPTRGTLDISRCATTCEVCGLTRRDLQVDASNLRRHVRNAHVIRAGEQRDEATTRIYDSVNPARPKAKSIARSKPKADPKPKE